jgi:hypothetical protein
VVTGIVTKGVRSPDRGMRIMRMCGHLIGEWGIVTEDVW